MLNFVFSRKQPNWSCSHLTCPHRQPTGPSLCQKFKRKTHLVLLRKVRKGRWQHLVWPSVNKFCHLRTINLFPTKKRVQMCSTMMQKIFAPEMWGIENKSIKSMSASVLEVPFPSASSVGHNDWEGEAHTWSLEWVPLFHGPYWALYCMKSQYYNMAVKKVGGMLHLCYQQSYWLHSLTLTAEGTPLTWRMPLTGTYKSSNQVSSFQ